jgi:hypothetical protein
MLRLIIVISMKAFILHTIESAPEGSKEILKGALKQNGFIPSLCGILAKSPEVYIHRLINRLRTLGGKQKLQYK